MKVQMPIRIEPKVIDDLKSAALCKEYAGEHTVLARDILAEATKDKAFMKKVIEKKRAGK